MTASPDRTTTRYGAFIRAVLRWKEPDGQMRAFYLAEGDTIQIGRESDNNIILNFPGISRYHAVLAWADGTFEISDLGSTNGTIVNNQRVVRHHMLSDGDHINLHELEIMFFEISPGSPQADPDPPEVKLRDDKTIVGSLDSPQPRLVVSAGSQEGQHFPLAAGTLVVGRATSREKFDISLQDRAVSRPHAQFEQRDGEFVVTDLGSANGTLVNGDRIAEPTILRDGDVVVLGETTLLFRSG